MSKISLAKQYLICGIVFVCTYISSKVIYNYASLKMTMYRDKSALYGRELKPGEQPSWP